MDRSWKFALILCVALLGLMRPVRRLSGQAHRARGVPQSAFLSEAATDADVAPVPWTLPIHGIRRLFAPALLPVFLLVLRARRIGFVPVRIRRLKLPAPDDPASCL